MAAEGLYCCALTDSPRVDCRASLSRVWDVHVFAVDVGIGGALIPASERTVSAERLFDAMNVTLSFQNKDGGWATYENTRYGRSSRFDSLRPFSA